MTSRICGYNDHSVHLLSVSYQTAPLGHICQEWDISGLLVLSTNNFGCQKALTENNLHIRSITLKWCILYVYIGEKWKITAGKANEVDESQTILSSGKWDVFLLGGCGEDVNICFKPELQMTLFIERLSTPDSSNVEERNSGLKKLLSETCVGLCRYFRTHT